MTYLVTWLPDAERELARLWMAAPERAAITAAANELDRRLAANGPEEGESREDDFRITFAPPLAVVFRAILGKPQVQVSHVWTYPRSR